MSAATKAKPIDVEKAREMVASDRWRVVVDGTTGCHVWQGYRIGDGYGRVRLDGGQPLAHRVAWVAANGKNPDLDLDLDHFACDRPACANPDHVRPVSRRENTLRGNTFAADHLAKTHCSRGHELTPGNLRAGEVARGKRACLTCNRARSRALAAAVRAAHEALGLTQAAYAARYGRSRFRAERIASAENPHAQAAIELSVIA